MKKNTKRIQHIDIAKAFGIMLIISSHVWTTTDLSESSIFRDWDAVLNSFYVPLFFILSGVFESSSTDWRKYMLRLLKLARYVAVFAIFGFLSIGIFKGVWAIKSCFNGTVIWFLIVLFIITTLFGIIKHIRRNLLILFILGLGGGGYVLASQGHSYFYVGQSLLCIPFYAIGFFFKKYFLKPNVNPKMLVLSLTLWICNLVFFYKAPQNIALNMVSQSFPSFYISAISGSIFVIELCKLSGNKFLTWYGRNSIVPMLVQMVFIWIIARFILADNMIVYYLLASTACMASGACIPLFRNKYYDIFQ